MPETNTQTPTQAPGEPDFATLLEESLNEEEIQSGEIITGEVVGMDEKEVIVHAGLKSEGLVSLQEFMDENGEIAVDVGDQVEVCVEAVDDGFGETRLSRAKALRARAWNELEQAYNNDEVVQGVLTGKVKGGFVVDINGIRTFLPGSLVDVRPVRDATYLEGKKLDFKVIKLDRRRNNAVVSRRAVVEEERSAERKALMDRLEEGQTVKGIVKNLTDYGAFIDLGGLDGLLHITDMAWKRVNHPSEMVNVGDEIEVKILKFDKERERISLGLKQLTEDPWADLPRRYPEGSRVWGKVTNITDYGAFVELEEGVEGLVHVSEMDWTNKNVHPSKVVQPGDEVEVMILDIDEERRRISLGMKQCQSNPWEEFAQTHAKGDRVQGVVKSITDFGIFVGLPGGIDGLVHLSDLSWSEAGEEAVRQYQKGEEVEAVVLSVDPERERISLGVKQLSDDPFSNWVAEHDKGTVIEGEVIEVEPKGARVHLADDVEGFVRVADISQDHVEDARSALVAGQKVEAQVTGVDRRNRMINLSIKDKDKVEEKEAVKDYQSKAAASGTTSLGDLLKEQMMKKDGEDDG
ncbi:30S ribosomal protein S1 [Thiohalorhabdus denitrificans]|uniref:Small ribosomal subunit protein bS1 n=1 Tax=Thiohalorhabdus denitrificans TaxID=381306 RepID=A0A0P9ED02_9GAMM|nr:30S ribosomal protein S1 [Thiohalorhabdus denitrificans]KPV40160.1 30S ribosomal protein S1 [Thiohalorhabdus denitrificans]SCY18149.1 SSU ribosomal protein S1P [Thiohalorhabdus denitrificans]